MTNNYKTFVIFLISGEYPRPYTMDTSGVGGDRTRFQTITPFASYRLELALKSLSWTFSIVANQDVFGTLIFISLTCTRKARYPL